LRRLAKITAPTTRRRISTPLSEQRGKENHLPSGDDGDEEDLKQPKLNFQLEDSVEEEDSEILVAPTTSVLLEDTDDDEEQPTTTFHNIDEFHADERRKSRVSFLPLSDPAIHDANDNDSADGDSTFLTERGRRAVSEEPTRMSRYSFGSIRMSEFGSELEIRRESDRQQKLAALEAEDKYTSVEVDFEDDGVNLGGETEDLRNVRRSASPFTDNEGDGSFHMPTMDNDSFQLDASDVVNDDVDAAERAQHRNKLLLADSILADEEHDHLNNGVASQSTINNRRRTLLESAVQAKTRPRQKLKMNRRGNLVPSLPSSLIKRIVYRSQEKAKKRKTTLSKDHMKALEQATEWFFEQISEDLEAYSSHGKRRKRIDVDDVLLLMRRQRVLRNKGELRRMANEWLPREMLNELDLPNHP